MDTICVEYQADEVQFTRLDFALIAIEDQAMLLCRPHQLMEVGVMFLFGTPEHSYIICYADGAWALLWDLILSWNMSWLKFKPNGSLRNRYQLKEVLRVVFILDS